MGKKSKFLKTLTIFGTALAAPLLLTGCFGGTENKTDFRVHNGFIQTTTDGTNWENLISLEDIKGEDGIDGIQYTIGPDGYWYLNGLKTNKKAVGTDGDAGSKITSITKDTTNSTAEKTIYIIELEDGTKYSFEVLNGTDGKDGTDADVWTIGTDGYWYKNSVKTDKKAIGTDGSNGEDGKDADIWTIGADGYWYKNSVKTNDKAIGENGTDGTSYYVHIKYADNNPTSNSDMKTTPSSWIGIYSGTSKTAPTTYSSYTWYCIKGQDLATKNYTINYEYNLEYKVQETFTNYKLSEVIESNTWLTNMPQPVGDAAEEAFMGWYIKGTNKKIENFDFVGGDVTLEAKWNKDLLASNGCVGFSYDSESDGYECKFNAASVQIPSIYLGENGIKYVKSISNNNGCESLKDIQIPNTVNTIKARAFMNCSNLTDITISDSITTIETYAFYGCSNLQKVNITSLDSWLNISVADDFANPVYYTRSLFVNDEEIKEVKIPSTITTIRNNAFAYCESLTSVQIEDGVINIGDYAFNNCSNLSDIVLPNGLNSIGQSAFSKCNNLASINIPNSVTNIGSRAFSNCENLTYVSLSENLQILNDYIFYRCEQLTSIVIPAKVKTIGKYAFDTCDLTYIIISNSVTNIDASAFIQCFSLEKVYYAGSESEWNNINIDRSNLDGFSDKFDKAKKYYYSDIEPAESDKYWHYDTDGVTPIIWGVTE